MTISGNTDTAALNEKLITIQNVLIGALFTILLLVSGYFFSAQATKINELEKVVQTNGNQITGLLRDAAYLSDQNKHLLKKVTALEGTVQSQSDRVLKLEYSKQ